MESHREVQTPGGDGNKDKVELSHYPGYRRTDEPDRAFSDSFRLPRCIKTQLSSGLTPFKHQQISGQESPFFTIPGKRFRPNHPEAVGPGERSTQEPEIVLITSRISSPTNKNITPTQIEHNVVTPENEESQTPDTNSRRTRSCNQIFTLHEIENTLQDLRKRTKIGKYSQYKRSSFKEKQHSRMDFKDKPKERVEEVNKKKNSSHNCGSTDHYANSCPKAKKKFNVIDQVPEEESPTEDSE
ncbi:hypothetical protein O181_000503 [Austropuccinia psidii MF-1]|uniref:Uncharacterized protein n=1 Tax=Austropuccinia psidii MF-1 TaxID=1389203 RepID=A0A9Q3B8M8_9BASI|nr:hypothetical protein [Austropuccinia psidii MF-1]